MVASLELQSGSDNGVIIYCSDSLMHDRFEGMRVIPTPQLFHCDRDFCCFVTQGQAVK